MTVHPQRVDYLPHSLLSQCLLDKNTQLFAAVGIESIEEGSMAAVVACISGRHDGAVRLVGSHIPHGGHCDAVDTAVGNPRGETVVVVAVHTD